VKRLTDEQRAKILKLRAEGLSMRIIAERLGISPSVVCKVLGEVAGD